MQELIEFSLQITGIPGQGLVRKLTAGRSYQTFNKRMRERDIRNGLNLFHTKNPQLGLPSVIPE
jgi:hypothetical protein